MVIAPAICFGIMAVFVIGCAITSAILMAVSFILFRLGMIDPDNWKEDDVVAIVLIGGGIFVGIVLLLWITYPELGTTFWVILTVFTGFVFAVLVSVFALYTASDQPASTKVPPSQKRSHQTTRKTSVPPSQQASDRSSAKSTVPPVHEQPTRAGPLLC